MSASTPSFQILDDPDRIAFQVDLPDGTAQAFSTTERDDVEVGERYWNSYDGELYRVTSVDDDIVEAVLEFGCGETPQVVSFDREWFTPNHHRLHHVAPQTN